MVNHAEVPQPHSGILLVTKCLGQKKSFDQFRNELIHHVCFGVCDVIRSSVVLFNIYSCSFSFSCSCLMETNFVQEREKENARGNKEKRIESWEPGLLRGTILD